MASDPPAEDDGLLGELVGEVHQHLAPARCAPCTHGDHPECEARTSADTVSCGCVICWANHVIREWAGP